MGRENGVAPVVTGLVFRGPLLGWEFSESKDDRPPLGNLKLEGRRHDGEPYWFKCWFRPKLSEQLAGLVVGTWLEVTVSAVAKVGRGGPYISYQADGITVLHDEALAAAV
jgi:hypothetical protein